MSKYHDYLGNVRVQGLEDQIFRFIDALQDAKKPEEGYAALIMLCLLATRELKLDFSQVVVSMTRALRDLDDTDTAKLAAVRDYLTREM